MGRERGLQDRARPPARGGRAAPRANRAHLRRRGIKATIARPRDQAAHRNAQGTHGGRPPAFDTEIYNQRHAVECGISLFGQHRVVATRYDKLAVRYEATIHVASFDIWLRQIRNTI